jgi:large subunit ribosomal protein L6
MSRIGKQPITLPSGTTLTISEQEITVQGSKGTLQVPMLTGVTVTVEGDQAIIARTDDAVRAEQGLIRSLLSNAIQGVSAGWQKDLELHGVGMRAALAGSNLNLSLGFSHPVTITPPQGITFTVTKNVVSVSGIDKQLVGEISAQIRKLRKPEPYKGKGIRYSNEYVRRKAGKTGKAGK